jgi:TPR repeat protein
MYFYGHGVAPNMIKSKEWYEKAAKQGDAGAYYSLGKMYYYGNGVDQDQSRSVPYIEAAAELGDIEAQIHLANIYQHGKGTDIDYNRAIALYTKAAQIKPEANTSIGEIYHYANNGIQDFSKALQWYHKAISSNSNDSFAMRNIGLLYEHGDGVEQNYKKALEYYMKSRTGRNYGAYYDIGRLYYHGLGVERDYTAAHEWMSKNYQYNDSKSMYLHIETVYNNFPEEITDSKEESKRYSLVTVYYLNAKASYYLGFMYENGLGEERDHEESIYCFGLALSGGVTEANRYIDEQSDSEQSDTEQDLAEISTPTHQ